MRTHVYAALIATVAVAAGTKTPTVDDCLKATYTDKKLCTWDICKTAPNPDTWNKTWKAKSGCQTNFPLAAITPKATEDISECIYGAVPKGSDLTTC